MSHRDHGAGRLRPRADTSSLIASLPPMTRGDLLALKALLSFVPIRTVEGLAGALGVVRRMDDRRATAGFAFIESILSHEEIQP